MKFIVRLAVFVLFIVSFLQANEYRYEELVKLSKDESKKFLVKYGTNQKVFEFRWTLHTNSSLIILRSYDRIVAQNVLYLQPKRDSFRVELKPSDGGYVKPYILVKFAEYDYETQKAVLKLFLSDASMQVNLEDLEDK